MTLNRPTQVPGDKLKKAIAEFSEILQNKPEASRAEILRMVEIKFDLSPRECEFLNAHFSDNKSA